MIAFWCGQMGSKCTGRGGQGETSALVEGEMMRPSLGGWQGPTNGALVRTGRDEGKLARVPAGLNYLVLVLGQLNTGKGLGEIT